MRYSFLFYWSIFGLQYFYYYLHYIQWQIFYFYSHYSYLRMFVTSYFVDLDYYFNYIGLTFWPFENIRSASSMRRIVKTHLKTYSAQWTLLWSGVTLNRVFLQCRVDTFAYVQNVRLQTFIHQHKADLQMLHKRGWL